MPSTLARDKKRIIKDMLIRFCGHTCMVCGAGDVFLDVDHVDGNSSNENMNNFRLLCHSCNVRESIRLRGIVSEREREPKDPTTELKTKVNYSQGSTEMQANEFGEPTFRDYVLRRVSRETESFKASLIKSGAEASGMQVVTCRNYLDKLISDEGPLKEFKPAKGGKMLVRFRAEFAEWSQR